MQDELNAVGLFSFRCLGPEGEFLWQRDVRNTVVTVGKNLAFNSFLNGLNYTVTGPYLGLIAAQGFITVSITDTMASHPGWLEAGAIPPTYSGSRTLCNWASAVNGAIGLATPGSFLIGTGGELQGAFIVFGPSATNVVGSSGGVLWSAGVLAGGPTNITAGSTLQINYSVTM